MSETVMPELKTDSLSGETPSPKRSGESGPQPITLQKTAGHFKTITAHKLLVQQECFRVGLYRQGLLHDLSKYSPEEFWVGARYYTGTESPNNGERRAIGYSSAWLHHKGRNRHHYEYWIDYSTHMIKNGYTPVKMPGRYVAEMFCDRVAASKIYHGRKYSDSDPLNYYLRGNTSRFLHPETAALLEKLLRMLAEKGEDETCAYIREHLHKRSLKKLLHSAGWYIDG
jgi:hypothetical protein